METTFSQNSSNYGSGAIDNSQSSYISESIFIHNIAKKWMNNILL